jgi:hypothetical protein
MQIYNVKGVESVRLSYLHDGSKKESIPPISLFVENIYKKYQAPNLSTYTLNKVVSLNCFGR